VDCIVLSSIVGVMMVGAVRAVRITSIKISQHCSNRTMYLNSRSGFVVETFIIPGFLDEP